MKPVHFIAIGLVTGFLALFVGATVPIFSALFSSGKFKKRGARCDESNYPVLHPFTKNSGIYRAWLCLWRIHNRDHWINFSDNNWNENGSSLLKEN